MKISIYTTWQKEPLEYDCIAVSSYEEVDDRDMQVLHKYFVFHYVEDTDGDISIRQHHIRKTDIIKVCGDWDKGLVGFLDKAVARVLILELGDNLFDC